MEIDLKQAAALLYAEFGDQGIAWARAQVEMRLASPSPSPSPSPATIQSEDPRAPHEDTGATADPDAAGYPDDSDSWYEDGEAFADDVSAQMTDMAISSIDSPEQVVNAVIGLVKMAGEVRKFEEVQVTKRVGIAAQRDVAIAGIRAQQELLQNYLDRSFDERAENFTRLFDVVDEALETGNMNALAMSLESVIKLATSSPFKDLRSIEETSAALMDPDHEWDF